MKFRRPTLSSLLAGPLLRAGAVPRRASSSGTAREHRPHKAERSWRCIVQGSRKPFVVSAHTKSEARARAKAVLGIRGRLPLGSVVLAA